MNMYFLYIALLLGTMGNIYDQSFREGNDAYYKKDFQTAIHKYEKLIESGIEHPVLFYNLGNAYYHFGKKGLAIANYERTLELNPSFKPAQDNLNKVLNETKRKLAIPGEPLWLKYLFIWHYGMLIKWTWTISLSFWVFGWVMIAFFMWAKEKYRKGMLIIGTLSIILGLVFFVSALIKMNAQPLGVIIASECFVHITPSDNSPSRFELYEGDRVRIEREENTWTLISTVDNERGWIKNGDIFVWKPPYRSIELKTNPEQKVSS